MKYVFQEKKLPRKVGTSIPLCCTLSVETCVNCMVTVIDLNQMIIMIYFCKRKTILNETYTLEFQKL